MHKSGIYQIVNKVDKKVYVGSAVDIASRWRVHRHLLLANKHSNIHLQRAFAKYGVEQFAFFVVEYCSTEDLLAKEQHWISAIMAVNKAYNIDPVAGSNLGRKCSEATKKLISANSKLHRHSEQHKANLRLKNSGEGNPAAVLTEERVTEIRCLFCCGCTNMTELAKAFGVTRTTVAAVVHHKSWPKAPDIFSPIKRAIAFEVHQ